MFRKDRGSKGGGVIAYARDDLSSEDQIWRDPMSKACGLKLHCQNPEVFFLERVIGLRAH